MAFTERRMNHESVQCPVIAGVSALGMTLTAQAHGNGHGNRIDPPAVPAKLEVEAGNEPFLVGHATGTQNYVACPRPMASPGRCSRRKPRCSTTRSSRSSRTSSARTRRGGIVCAAWQHSRDTSTVWARATQTSTDSQFVAPGAIPWLLLNMKDTGTQEGPTGGRKLTRTTFIQRVNTVGGVAPSTGCAQSSDVGSRAFVPYKADYFFYEDAERHQHEDN